MVEDVRCSQLTSLVKEPGVKLSIARTMQDKINESPVAA
jgi:hypothetical protein